MIKPKKKTRAQRSQDNKEAFWAAKIAPTDGPKERAKILWDRLHGIAKYTVNDLDRDQLWDQVERALFKVLEDDLHKSR